MATTAPKHIFDRRRSTEEAISQHMNNKVPGVTKRQMILCSENADSLTDEDLYNHHKDINYNKRLCVLFLFGVPALFYFKYNTIGSVVKSAFVTLLVTRKFYTSGISSRKCDYSYDFAKKSSKRFDGKVLSFNKKKFANHVDKWDSSKNGLTNRQWMQLNTYH